MLLLERFSHTFVRDFVAAAGTPKAKARLRQLLPPQTTVRRGDMRSDIDAAIDEAVAFDLDRGRTLGSVAERFGISRARVQQRRDRRHWVNRNLAAELDPLMQTLAAIAVDIGDQNKDDEAK